MTSIKTRATIISALLIAGCLSTLATTQYALEKLRVGGPLYDQIILGKDLLADILPPPEYIIEPYLEATLALNDPSSMPTRAERLASLKKEYMARHAYWLGQVFDSQLKATLTVGAHTPAAQFWSVLDEQFLPALARGDRDASQHAYLELSAAYGAHRAVIDRLVKLSGDYVTATEAHAAQEKHFLTRAAVVVSGLMLTLLVLCAVAVRRGLVIPLGNVTHAMRELTAGHLDVDLQRLVRRDEIGDMARALVVFRDSSKENRRMEREAAEQRRNAEQVRLQREAERSASERQADALRKSAEGERMAREADKARQAEQAEATMAKLGAGLSRLAAGDLQCTIDQPFAATFERLRTDFNSTVVTLRSMIVAIIGSANLIKQTTDELAKASDELSRRTEQQAASIEQSSAATSELSVAVDQAAVSSTRTQDIISAAKRDSEVGAVITKKTIDAMSGIRESSQQINQIIGVVDEIAFQTNLLALNAGVEAARAGESGRGFAVVATEVRALAQRSAEAAKEIKSLIIRATAEVDAGFQLVGDSGGAIDRIITQVSGIDSGIADIATRAIEQSSTLKQVNLAIGEIDQMTQQNASMAEQASAACRSLADEAANLSVLLSKFCVSKSADNVGRSASPRSLHRPEQHRLERAS